MAQDSIVVQKAKSLVQYDLSDKALDKAFSDVESPALLMLSKHLTIPQLSEYIGSTVTKYISISPSTNSNMIKIKLNYIGNLVVGNMITLTSENADPDFKDYNKVYVIQSIDPQTLEIEVFGTYTTTDNGSVLNNNVDNILYANAYFILALVAQSAQNIVKNDVIYSAQQFGQGSLAPASMSEKKMLVDRYISQAQSFLGSVVGLVC